MTEVYVLVGGDFYGEEMWTEAVFTDKAVAERWKTRLNDKQRRRRKNRRSYFEVESAVLDPREPLS